jgi:hypothetical protein
LSLQTLGSQTQFNEYELWNAVVDERSGKPRLRVARSFFQDLQQSELSYLVEAFRFWRDYDEYMLLKGTHRETGQRKWKAIKCSKRGNDVYGARTRKRLGFLKWAENLTFFKAEDFDVKTPVKTRLLWVTLTMDPKLASLKEAWETCEYYYNLWITNLRNRYGKIHVLKFPQASPDQQGLAYGYLHFHVVLLFEEHEFTAFPWMTNKGKLEYRIHERDEFKEQGKWHSFVDIKAISSMAGIYNYAVKHHENAGYGDSDEAVLNNALCWLFKKKAYTISGSFRATYHEFIQTLRNSKAFQSTFEGDLIPVWSWKLVGFKSWAQIVKFLGVSDPPPWFIDLNLEQIDVLLNGFPRK